MPIKLIHPLGRSSVLLLSYMKLLYVSQLPLAKGQDTLRTSGQGRRIEKKKTLLEKAHYCVRFITWNSPKTHDSKV